MAFGSCSDGQGSLSVKVGHASVLICIEGVKYEGVRESNVLWIYKILM